MKVYTLIITLLLFSYLIGCAVGPDFVRPKAPKIDHYTYKGDPTKTINANDKTQVFKLTTKIVNDWWRLFNSTKLGIIIKKAFANNQTLLSAQANLRQSQENLSAGYGIFCPQIDSSFDSLRQKSSQSRSGATSSIKSIFNLYTLTATVSYALDVFGGERRTLESLRAQVDFQRYNVMATYLALSGNIVNAVIARAAYSEQIKATEEMIKLQKDQVGLTEIQAKAGIVPYSNLFTLQSQLASTKALLPPLKQKLSQTEHLLSTLAGKTAAEWSPPKFDFADLNLPDNLPICLPSELVHQRPDILEAEAQLHIASAEIGIATAALYPSFILNGSYGQTNTSLDKIFKKNSNFWSFGANITAPIFHGGTLRAKKRAAVEAFNQSLADYRQTVLTSFNQVADILRALEYDAYSVFAQFQALASSEKALKLIQANYKAGIANYLEVLIADIQFYQAKIGYLQALAQRFQDTSALFVALGGGWKVSVR